MLTIVDLRITLSSVFDYFIYFKINFVETKTKLNPSIATTATTTGLTQFMTNKYYKNYFISSNAS